MIEKLEGKISLYEQEGGFAAPIAEINGECVASWIAKILGQLGTPESDASNANGNFGNRGGCIAEEGEQRGLYRITIEQLDEPTKL